MSTYDKLSLDILKSKDVSFGDKVGYTTDFLRGKGYDAQDVAIRFSGSSQKDPDTTDSEKELEDEQPQTTKDKFAKLKSDLGDFENSNYDQYVKQLNSFLLSDGQIAKKIALSRFPNLTDGEANLLMYGADLRKEIGPAYKKFQSERQKEKELELQPRPKTKKEKRKEKKKLFKPISKDHAIFVEAKALMRKFLDLMQKLLKKIVDLAKQIGRFGVEVGTTVSAAVVIAAPVSFNVPGAITLILSLLRSFDELQNKILDFLPLTEIITLLPFVLPDDKVEPTLNKVNAIFKQVMTISQTLNALSAALPSMSEAKQEALKGIQADIDKTDAELKALKREDFENDGQFNARKAQLEQRKITLSERANKLLK